MILPPVVNLGRTNEMGRQESLEELIALVRWWTMKKECLRNPATWAIPMPPIMIEGL
jgi:hypothetical protein